MATYGSIRYSGVADARVITGTDSYTNTTDLPTVGVDTGAMAYVSATNKLYMWNGSAWFNIAIVNQAPTAITGNQASYELAMDGTPTTVTLTSTDPEGFPLTWSATTSGDTAVGTLIQADNIFTITPSTNEADIGTLSVTFSVTDGNNTETSVSSFTLAFLSPLWDETVLSIGTSSTNGLNNSTFIDRSTNAHTVTPAGTPLQTAFHPYLENWGIELDGTGDYLSVAYNAALNILSGNFTVECWINHTSTQYDVIVSSWGQTGVNNTDGWIISAGANNELAADWGAFSTNASMIVTANNVIQTGRWHHIAFTRSGNTFTLWVDGVSVGSATNSASNTAQYGIDIGFYGNGSLGGSPQSFFNGYISNLRIVKGTALYTSTFTPPTEKLTAVSGTSLLTCQSNRFIDNSSNAHAITVAGDPKVSAFNPFGQESEYAVGENKGSVLFNATSYLTAPQIPFGTADFTVEGWHFLNSRINLYPILFSNYNAFGAGAFSLIAGHNSSTTTQYQIAWNSSFPTLNAGTIRYNEWAHFAVVRNSGTVTLYINGVSVGSFSGAQTINGVGSAVSVSYGQDVPTTSQLDGYISDWTISAGTAKYTANFTPPTAPVGDTNASLYLPMDNALIRRETILSFPLEMFLPLQLTQSMLILRCILMGRVITLY